MPEHTARRAPGPEKRGGYTGGQPRAKVGPPAPVDMVPVPCRCGSMASKYHEIRGLGWNDQLLHATVFNRRHHLMEVA